MTTNAYPLILASTAPWRAELLRTKFRNFETMAPPYDESFPIELKPADLALRHAVGKARASAALRPTAYILAADQTAEFRGLCLQNLPISQVVHPNSASFREAHIIYTVPLPSIHRCKAQ